MKLVKMTCPYCGAALEVEEGQKTVVCQYCGQTVTPQIVVDSFGVLILPECVYESVRNQNLPQIAGGRTARYCRHNLSKVRCYG